MLEARYLKESVFKDCGEKTNREGEKSKSISRNQKAFKKVEQFKWDWLCLSVDPCNIDKQHLVNFKQQQVRFVSYQVICYCCIVIFNEYDMATYQPLLWLFYD